MRHQLPLSCLLILFILSGCSTAPKVAQHAERSITPTQAASDNELVSQDKQLQWGGVIVETTNLREVTELQILAYPLKSSGQPDITKSPAGRFIARRNGYLESVDYRKGRQVTATGQLVEKRAGQVGEADYTFPVLQADELVLWPEQRNQSPSPRVNFGLGVGSGGRSWGGIGIGVGF
jgi:outer membrane lipoprotein